MNKLIPLLVILSLLVACSAPVKKPVTKLTPTKTLEKTEPKANLEVLYSKVVKEVMQVKVIGEVRNTGNKDADSVTVKAACTGLGSSTVNTGVDLIDIPAGETSVYSVIVLVAPHKVDKCSVRLRY